jgi:hypothetical protein
MEGTFSEMFCNMTSITGLYLGATKFNGTLPACLSEMSQLTDLDVSDAFFTGPIPNMEKLKNLNSLYLNDITATSKWEGELPKGFGDLVKLKILFMPTASLVGPLPPINFYLLKCVLEVRAII